MAYETGQTTGVADLLARIETFLQATGAWTKTGNVLHSGSNYLHLYEIANGNVRDGLALRGGAGEAAGALTGAAANGSMIRTAEPELGGDVVWPATYHLFAHADPIQWTCVLAYNGQYIQWLSAGEIKKHGTWTGGNFFGGSMPEYSSGQGVVDAIYWAPWGSGEDQSSSPVSAGLGIWNRAMGSGYGNMWLRCGIGGGDWKQNDQQTDPGDHVVGTFDGSTINADLRRAGRSLYNGQPILDDIIVSYTMVEEKRSIIGDPVHVKHIDVRNLGTAEIVNIGGDEYMVFPMFKKAIASFSSITSKRNGDSATLGFAVRYDTTELPDGTPELATGSDWFIREAGTALGDHPPTTPDDYQKSVPDQKWGYVTSGAPIELSNTRLQNATLPRHRIGSSGAVGRALSNVRTTNNVRFEFRLNPVAGSAISRIVCADDMQNYIELRYNGGTRLNLYEVVDDVISPAPVAQSPVNSINNTRPHVIEMEITAGVLTVLSDQDEMLAYDVSAFTGRRHGYRTEAIVGSTIECSDWHEYYPINRVYCNTQAAGANLGTLADPLNTRTAIQSAWQSEPANTRFCIRAGEYHGVGYVFSAQTDKQFMPWGADATQEHAKFASPTIYSGGVDDIPGWTLDGNGEYSIAVAGEDVDTLDADGNPVTIRQPIHPIVVMEDGFRLNGNCQANLQANDRIYHQLIAFGRLPVAGSLQEGDWAWDDATERLYIKPRGGTTAGKVFETCFYSTIPVIIKPGARCRFQGFEAYGGGSRNAQIFQTETGDDVVIQESIGHSGNGRGITVGEATVFPGYVYRPRMLNCISFDVVAKGCSTAGPNDGKGMIDGILFGILNYWICRNKADVHDAEGAMFTPRTNGSKLCNFLMEEIGYPDLTDNFQHGQLHPMGVNNDSGNKNKYFDGVIRACRAGVNIGSVDLNEVDSCEFYNVLIDNCGSVTDPGNHRTCSAIHLRAKANRSNTSEAYTMTGVHVHHVSIVNSGFPDQGTNGNSDISAWTSGTTNQIGDRLTAQVTDILIWGSNSKRYISLESDSPLQGAHCDVHFDRNLYQATNPNLVEAGRHHSINHAVAWATPADLINRTDDRANDETFPARDVNSAVGDANLNASYQPQAGSPAIGLGDDSLCAFDLLMRPRTTNTVGAFEAA